MVQNQNNIQELTKFKNNMVSDNLFKKLKDYLSKFNMFDLLKISESELMHSNVLAYLLNSEENHNLNTNFLKLFINMLIKKEGISSDFSKNLTSYKIYREKESIDITIRDNKYKRIIVIENKIKTEDHFKQLKKYREKIEKMNFKYKSYIYLTPFGDEPRDKEELENWICVSYEEIFDILQEMDKSKLSNKIRNIINDYIDIVRRNIMKDKKLIKICNEIYQQNPRMFDLVYKYKEDTYTYNLLKNYLKNQAKIKLNDQGNKKYLTFTTCELERFVSNNSIKNNAFYRIEITNTNIDIYLYFEYKEDEEKEIEKLAEIYLDTITDKQSRRRKIGNYLNKYLFVSFGRFKKDDLTYDKIEDEKNLYDWLDKRFSIIK